MFRLVVLCALSGSLMIHSADAKTVLYVSVAKEKRIVGFEVDNQTGKLTPRIDVQCSGEPGALAVSPEKDVLFASLRSTKELASYRINPATGELTLIGSINTPADATYLATDQTGSFLLSASYAGAVAIVHRIGPQGVLEPEPVQVVETEKNAHSIQTDATNRFVFVPHTGPNRIYQFHFDPKSGKLSPNDPPTVFTGEKTGPRHFAFHPRLAVIYFDNEDGSSVTAFDFDRQAGTLKMRQTLSTLPADFTGNNTGSHIELTPNAKFLYASNRGHDSLAGFALDTETGSMKPLGQFPTEKKPRAFSIEPSGRYLYAAGQDSGRIAAYNIDAESGHLKPIATYEVGQQPSYSIALQLPE